MTDVKPLSTRQQAFVAAYIKHGNATQAAADAGYAVGCDGSALLKNPAIAAVVARRVQRISDIVDFGAIDVLRELGRIAFADIGEAFDDDGKLLHARQMPEGFRRALGSIEVDEIWGQVGFKDRDVIGQTKKIKTTDKIRALELLAKHYKLLTEVHELAGAAGSGIAVTLTMPANGYEAPKK